MHSCVEGIEQLVATVQTEVNMKCPALMATRD